MGQQSDTTASSRLRQKWKLVHIHHIKAEVNILLCCGDLWWDLHQVGAYWSWFVTSSLALDRSNIFAPYLLSPDTIIHSYSVVHHRIVTDEGL